MEKRVYTVSDITEILEVSRTKAYEYIKKAYSEGAPFKVIKVGGNFRIPKNSFDQLLEGNDLNFEK